MNAANLNIHLLPPQLRKLVTALGVPDTRRLLIARGGTRIKLPRRAGGWLGEMLGDANVTRLISEFGAGVEITLPMADKISAQLRDLHIYADHAGGMSIAKLALRYQLTTRHVLNILQAERERAESPVQPAPQPDLFPALQQ